MRNSASKSGVQAVRRVVRRHGVRRLHCAQFADELLRIARTACHEFFLVLSGSGGERNDEHQRQVQVVLVAQLQHLVLEQRSRLSPA